MNRRAAMEELAALTSEFERRNNVQTITVQFIDAEGNESEIPPLVIAMPPYKDRKH
jgi:hypothetical protein